VLADRKAKLAAAGKDFGVGLPASFTSHLMLTVDPGHLKQELKVHFEVRALWAWEDSAAGTKQLARTQVVEAHGFLERICGLPRRQAVLLYRLVTGHITLQRYL
jgi:hypothetical protein